MGLEFVGDAINLSGLTGSKLKSEIIGEYYPFWWNITSGGDRNNHDWPTAIVELDAATAEMYIEESNETILGSSGHALALKCGSDKTKKLKTILVERDLTCYSHLKEVIRKRWPSLNINEVEGPIQNNRSNVYLMNVELDKAIALTSLIDLGSSLFFFDPLRGVPFDTIDKVARSRIKAYYRTGTEFIVFVFTSDWFLGRGQFTALPQSNEDKSWSEPERQTVIEADELFGHATWRREILNDKPIHKRELDFIELYKSSLHKWFRYVLPMPFNPKKRQIFHLILCSNFEVGVRATRGFFCDRAHNPGYKPDNKSAHNRFKAKHGDIYGGLTGNQKPKQWRILWTTITQHEEGLCDYLCRDFEKIEPVTLKRQESLKWLEEKGYLVPLDIENPWGIDILRFKINWDVVKCELGVDPPNPLEPLSLRRTSLREISQ